ncbi:MAG: hypothetical protein Q8O05_07215 [Chloroflexota bacterium]|nr:hypothetical protein [Chloroflexota bacterium]
MGLLLARIVSRLLTEPLLQVIAYIAGVALALAGLVIIVFGISKRRRQT